MGSLKPDWDKVFGVLYDDHKVYLGISEIQIPSRTKYPTKYKSKNLESNQNRQKVTLNKNKVSGMNKNSADEHVKYLLFLQTEYQKKNSAAKTIQQCWNRYMNRSIYFHLKEYINKCYQSDPSAVLRHVNPREASLIDLPSGATVRFKLAGPEFPPKILYRICSYRPVARVDSTLPKNSANMSNKDCDKLIFKEFKRNKYNDWRVYDYKNIRSNLKIKQSKKPVKYVSRSKNTTLKNNVEIAWIKTQYGI